MSRMISVSDWLISSLPCNSCVYERIVPFRLELLGKLGAALGDDAAVNEDVHEVGLHVVEDALIVRDHERAHFRADEIVYPVRNDSQRVDVEPRVRLVEDRDSRAKYRHLQDLDALL